MTDAAPPNSDAVDIEFHYPGAKPQNRGWAYSSPEKIVIENISTYPLNFEGCWFLAGTERAYRFSAFVDHVEPGAEVEVAGGAVEHTILEKSPPGYVIHTGLVSPLLDENGGNFFIRDATGEVVVAGFYEGE